jgi:hypothetical protein
LLLFTTKTVIGPYTFQSAETIVLQVDFCGSEVWLLTMRREYKLQVPENKVLEEMFGPKQDLGY